MIWIEKYNIYSYTHNIICGNIQVVARVLEVAIHKIHEIKFPLNKIIHGLGFAPLPPIAKDFVTVWDAPTIRSFMEVLYN